MAKIKNPSNKKRYDAYKNSGRRLINKEEKQKRHEKRMAKFAKRREEGKAYEYKPNPYKEGSKEYIVEQNERLAKSKKWHKLPLSQFDSVMAKLDNYLNKLKMEEKAKVKNKLENKEEK